jgi:hypothetical protein
MSFPLSANRAGDVIDARSATPSPYRPPPPPPHAPVAPSAASRAFASAVEALQKPSCRGANGHDMRATCEEEEEDDDRVYAKE